MRVTNKMLSNNFLRDMRNNLGNMKILQGQLTSGKEIRRPSDNPFKVARAMMLHTDINTNKQYNDNIKDTINWLDTTDTALNQAGNVLQRVRELMISSGNAAYGTNERSAIKDEINEKVGELAQILNTNFDGKYVFAGSRGTAKPLGTDKVQGNTELFLSDREGLRLTSDSEAEMLAKKLSVEISQGVTMEYNITAAELLKFTDEKGKEINLSEVFKNITTHLDSADTQESNKLVGEDLENITSAIGNLLKIRAEVGAKQNRMDSAKEKNEDESYNMTEILSQTEDIDITEKVMEYTTAQTVYMASLQTSAKVIQPSLIDYIR
ncbi:flagellar hook-associated protein FlgL [Clostridium polynesiense]|uniref:flagellar hook-associated protein FlgL n=1 Tax=Clostridium polynesiense TaxID=1325933 RepID=UPI00058AF94C|nr:flagellar hook-associated protein FlgL [Clostridium polynesiense]